MKSTLTRIPGFVFVLWIALVGLSLHECPGAQPKPVAAVFASRLPGHDEAFASELVRLAEGAGYTAQTISIEVLTNESLLASSQFQMLVLPNATKLPAASMNAVEKYLADGGNLLALGVPAWDAALFQIGERWMTREEYAALVNSQKPRNILVDFERTDLSQWQRNSNEPKTNARFELAPDGQNRVLHAVMDNYTGWDTLSGPTWALPFGAGEELTCFRTKGGPQTRQLSLEWIEEDGSRWIATVDLTEQWRSYALPPESFRAWTPPPNRSGPNDKLNPKKARRFTLGIAASHTANHGRRHEYWFDDLGTAPHPFPGHQAPISSKSSYLEALSPSFLFYPVTTPVQLVKPAGQSLIRTAPPQGIIQPGNTQNGDASDPSRSGVLYALHPRPQGPGFDQRRPWRWQPLIEARAPNGDYRGAVGVLTVFRPGRFRHSMVASFTPDSSAFYRQAEMGKILSETMAAMRNGVFLLDGGTEYFTVFEGQTFRLGATFANRQRTVSSSVEIQITVRDTSNSTTLFSEKWITNIMAGAVGAVQMLWKPQYAPANGFDVAVDLFQDGKPTDQLEQRLHVWKPKERPAFIGIEDGRFRLEGRPWKSHGVNYMPSTGIAQPSGDYFEHWIGRGAYDPSAIQRDLERVKNMGLNSVSAFIHYRSLDAQHLLDFLRRCEALGLKVNLSLRPGTPMDFRWNEMKALIEYYRLAQNDTVFAYDMAWEPSHYDRNYQRQHYSTLWRDWVGKRYSSLVAAEKAWDFDAPRLKDALDVPGPEHLCKDGAWRKMTADYRRFLDELVHSKYEEARRLVRSIDPNHPVSFRMQFSGDPTFNNPGLMAYDFCGLSKAVDIWEPEAYGRIGDWEMVKPGRFTAAYARLCDPAKPVFWAEMGNHVWDMNTMTQSPERLAFTAQYYRDFYRMLTDSGADGISFWWFAGGFRYNENSDYGILNPDGTDREITRVIREDGTRYMNAPYPRKPDHWIEVDRDADARSLHGIYEAAKKEYWDSIAAGREPGLKWKRLPHGLP